MIFMGIDPGATGALGLIIENNKTKFEVYDCPESIARMRDLVGKILKKYPEDEKRVMVEKVNPFFRSSAKSAFTFGGNFSAWQSLLACNFLVYIFVTPRTWQKGVFDSAKKMDNTKKQSVELAERLFPGLEFRTKRGKLLDGRSDAMLIAEYCRRVSK